MVEKHWILIFSCCLVLVYGNPVERSSENNENEIESGAPDLDISTFAKCSYKNGMTGLINCAAMRALKILQQATSKNIIEIFPGISLISDSPQSGREGKNIQSGLLPTNFTENTNKLMELIVDATGRFLSGRTLKIKIPEINRDVLAKALEEGRGKMKKGMMSPLLLGLGAKFLLLKGAMLLGIAFMAIKALLVSKVAFVLAAIFGLQSLFGGAFSLKDFGGFQNFGKHGWMNGWTNSIGGGGGYGPSYGTPHYHGWTTNNIGGGGGGGGWGNQYPYARSIDNIKEDELIDDTKTKAQELAYSEQRP